MANEARYMPLYTGKYLAATAHMSALAHGAYMLLILNYWQRAKPLPNDDRKLAIIARCTPEEWADIKDDISEFFEVTDDAWKHDTIESEITKAGLKIEQARRAGKASGAKKDDPKKVEETDTSNGRSTDAQRTFNHKVRLGKEEVKPDGFTARGARKSKGFVKQRTSVDAAMDLISRRGLEDDTEANSSDRKTLGHDVQLLPAIRNG